MLWEELHSMLKACPVYSEKLILRTSLNKLHVFGLDLICLKTVKARLDIKLKILKNIYTVANVILIATWSSKTALVGIIVCLSIIMKITFVLTCLKVHLVNQCSMEQGEGGWSGGAMVLGKLPVPGRPTIWITVGQGPTALAVGASWGCLDIFALIYPFSSLSPSLWETARYRLKYCLKGGPLNPKQPTNQPKSMEQ